MTIEVQFTGSDGLEYVATVSLVTPGEKTVIRMDPDDSYEGSGPEWEIDSITADISNQQVAGDIPAVSWPAFLNSHIEELIFEKANKGLGDE
jgi:hypothetical protein